MSASQEAWQRLGEMLEGRRVGMDPRYKNLVRFSGERGIDYRLAWDIEHAARTNYRRPTLTAIEVAYGVRPGSIRLVLDGGELQPLDSEAVRPAADPDFEAQLARDKEILDVFREDVLRGAAERRRLEAEEKRANGKSA